MNIRIVRMLVRDGFVPMSMRMRLSAIPVDLMVMLVMLIMRVSVRVFEQLVRVFMIVRFGQV